MSRIRWSLFALLAVTALLTAFRSEAVSEARHLALVRSEPAGDSTVVSPAEIRLWFTQAPQEGSTQIRLLGQDDALLPTGDVTAMPDESFAFSATVLRPLGPGRYTVSWRALAQDGHAVSQQFTFTVRTTD